MTIKNTTFKATFRGSRVDTSVNNGVRSGGVATSTSQTITATNLWSGTENPQWRDQVRNHVSATTVFTSTRTKIKSYRPGSYALNTRWPTNIFNPQLGIQERFSTEDGPMQADLLSLFSNEPSTLSTASARNMAVAKLVSKLNAQTSSADVAEDLGEIKTTLNSLRRPLASAHDLINSTLQQGIVHLTKRKKVDALKALADTYLEFQFGWAPLADSIGKAYVSLQNREIFAKYSPIHATSGDVSLTGSTYLGQTSSGSLAVNSVSKATGGVKVVFEGEWANKVGRERTSLNEALALTPQNFIPTVWNLIPYSFLIDYFVNVNDIIGAYNVPWSGVTWMLERQRRVFEFESSSGVGFDPNTVKPVGYLVTSAHSLPFRLNASRTVISRIPVTSMPMPTVEFSTKLSRVQATNVLALLTSKVATYRLIARSVFRINKPLVTFK